MHEPAPDPLRHCDPVGIVEVCHRLGVTRKAFDKWRERGLGFPEPARLVGGRPAWAWAQVEAWAQATSRLPPGPGG